MLGPRRALSPQLPTLGSRPSALRLAALTHGGSPRSAGLGRLRHPRLRGWGRRRRCALPPAGVCPAPPLWRWWSPTRRGSTPPSSTRSWRATATRRPTPSSRSPRATSRRSRRSSSTCGRSGTPGPPPGRRHSAPRLLQRRPRPPGRSRRCSASLRRRRGRRLSPSTPGGRWCGLTPRR